MFRTFGPASSLPEVDRIRVTIDLAPQSRDARGGPLPLAWCVARDRIHFTDAVSKPFWGWADELGDDSVVPEPSGMQMWGAEDLHGKTTGEPLRPIAATDPALPDSWVAVDSFGWDGQPPVGWDPIDPAEALRALLDWDGSDEATVSWVCRFGLVPDVEPAPAFDPPRPESAAPVRLFACTDRFRPVDGGRSETQHEVDVVDVAEQSWRLSCLQRTAGIARDLIKDPDVAISQGRGWYEEGWPSLEKITARTPISDRRIVGEPTAFAPEIGHLEHLLRVRLVEPAGPPLSFTYQAQSSHPAVADHNTVLRSQRVEGTGTTDDPTAPGSFNWDAEPDPQRAWGAICRYLLDVHRSVHGTCERCGTPFPQTRKDRRYCTAECSNAARQKRHRDRNKPQ